MTSSLRSRSKRAVAKKVDYIDWSSSEDEGGGEHEQDCGPGSSESQSWSHEQQEDESQKEGEVEKTEGRTNAWTLRLVVVDDEERRHELVGEPLDSPLPPPIKSSSGSNSKKMKEEEVKKESQPASTEAGGVSSSSRDSKDTEREAFYSAMKELEGGQNVGFLEGWWFCLRASHDDPAQPLALGCGGKKKTTKFPTEGLISCSLSYGPRGLSPQQVSFSIKDVSYDIQQSYFDALTADKKRQKMGKTYHVDRSSSVACETDQLVLRIENGKLMAVRLFVELKDLPEDWKRNTKANERYQETHKAIFRRREEGKHVRFDDSLVSVRLYLIDDAPGCHLAEEKARLVEGEGRKKLKEKGEGAILKAALKKGINECEVEETSSKELTKLLEKPAKKLGPSGEGNPKEKAALLAADPLSRGKETGKNEAKEKEHNILQLLGPEEQELARKTNDELREMLRERKLPVRGSKKSLLLRLTGKTAVTLRQVPATGEEKEHDGDASEENEAGANGAIKTQTESQMPSSIQGKQPLPRDSRAKNKRKKKKEEQENNETVAEPKRPKVDPGTIKEDATNDSLMEQKRAELREKTVPELKKMLKGFSLKVGGSKDELVDRLMKSFSSPPFSGPAPQPDLRKRKTNAEVSSAKQPTEYETEGGIGTEGEEERSVEVVKRRRKAPIQEEKNKETEKEEAQAAVERTSREKSSPPLPVPQRRPAQASTATNVGPHTPNAVAKVTGTRAQTQTDAPIVNNNGRCIARRVGLSRRACPSVSLHPSAKGQPHAK